jgi:hypothetical protein
MAGATLENCQVIRMVDDSILEESLSLEEYPDVSVEEELGSFVLHIGANIFENDREFRVEAIPVIAMAGSFGFQAVNVANDEAYVVSGGMKTVNGRPKKLGTVSYRTASETKVLAEIACD